MANENRKLATIQIVKDAQPIPDADAIEVASVMGWKVVTKKGEVKPGDKVVYFEIDSFLPVHPRYEFLRTSSFKSSPLLGEGFRLRTIKLRGQISQGLILPISSFPEYDLESCEEGSDLTEILGVKLWQIPETEGQLGRSIGSFHHTVPKTDEYRMQSDEKFASQLIGLPYYITEKIDGSSMTIVRENGETKFYSRSLRIAPETSPLKFILERTGAWDALEKLNKNIFIQGEIHGPGIQGNKLGLKELDFKFFTLGDPLTGSRFSFTQWNDVLESCGLLGKLNSVLVIEIGDSFQYTLDDLLKIADRKYPNGKTSEGIVVRPQESMLVNSRPLSFKVINNKFLLKYEEE